MNSSAKKRSGAWAVWVAAAALSVACLLRFAEMPTFWLDEAFVAVSLKERPVAALFDRLEYGQYFPRLYLSAIAGLRYVFGYEIWSLRLLPALCFIAATFCWAKLLLKRAGGRWELALAGAGLLLGATYWLDQTTQLKQYTFDTLLAFIPFLVNDSFYDRALGEGKGRGWMVLLALPCALSYTYPMALGARLGGWYLWRGRRESWRLRMIAAGVLGGTMAAALASLWLTDLRFNLQDSAAYYDYWRECILRAQLGDPRGAARLLVKFLWGWQGRQPMVTAFLVPLQLLGIYAVARRWRRREQDAEEDGAAAWGSRSMGALVLLIGVIAASLLVNYPICAGRVTLFTQAHTQIIALEGAALALALWNAKRRATMALAVFLIVLLIHSGLAFGRFLATEPAENLRPVVSLIDAREAGMVWVHPCSVAQARALPDGLPVSRVIFAETGGRLPRGQRCWVLWSHLGDGFCVSELDRARQQARSWRVVYEGADRGLALAEF